jgi:flagellar basal-body rod protein FlgB
MIDTWLNNPAVSMLEHTVNFTEQRHEVIMENIANVDTPGYIQKDVSTSEFQSALRDAIDKQQHSYALSLDPQDTRHVQFGPGNSVQVTPTEPRDVTAFHDRGVRSMEQLMGDLADNAEAHNMATAFLKDRYGWLQKAIQMRV